MNVDFTARRITLKPEVKALIEKKLAKLEKVLPRDVQAHVILRSEKKSVTFEITLSGKKNYTATESGDSQEAAAHAALDRIGAQAKKSKAKVKEDKKHRVSGVKMPSAWPSVTDGDEPAPMGPRRETVTVRQMFEEDALNAFHGSDREAMVFRDPNTDALRVLYRRRDGRIGLVVPR